MHDRQAVAAEPGAAEVERRPARLFFVLVMDTPALLLQPGS
jgi:hypothetical protein